MSKADRQLTSALEQDLKVAVKLRNVSARTLTLNESQLWLMLAHQESSSVPLLDKA